MELVPQSQLSPYAKRLPQMAKTGDPEQDARAKVQHPVLQQVISTLQRHPDMILETMGWLQRRLATTEKAEQKMAAEDAIFEEKECTTVGRLPDDWVCGWLQHETCGALSDQLVLKMLKHDASVIDRLKRYALQLSTATTWPSECSVKKVCSRVLSERHKQVGAPLSKEWVETRVSQTGIVNWKVGGCELCLRAGAIPFRAASVEHLSEAPRSSVSMLQKTRCSMDAGDRGFMRSESTPWA